MSSSSSSVEQLTFPKAAVSGYNNDGPGLPADFNGIYMAKPAKGRKNAAGHYDLSTPSHLFDLNRDCVAIVSTCENRNKDEEIIIEHYARQKAAKKAGTYNPEEDPPVILTDLVPQVVVVVNKIFNLREIQTSPAKVEAYMEKLAESFDFDILALNCGQAMCLPISRSVQVKHRDPILNAQTQAMYERTSESAQAMLERAEAAVKSGKKKFEEQKKKEAAANAIELPAAVVNEEPPVSSSASAAAQ